MKRILLITGVILLITGIIVTPWAVLIRSVEPITDPYPARQEPVTDSWSISANYSAQQRLMLSISPGKNWAMFAGPSEDYQMGAGIQTSVLLVYVVVTDPNGGKTKVEIVYIAPEAEGQQLERTLFIFADKVLSDGGGLTFEEEYITQRVNSTILMWPPKTPLVGQFMGITNYEGRYELTILQNISDTPTPPYTLMLYKQPVKFVQPFLLIAPVGGVFIAVGGCATMLSRKKAERGLRLKNSISNAKTKK